MMPDYVNVKHVVAKRYHICCECHGAIKPLYVYENQSGKWDGEFSRYKTCLPCEQARDWLLQESDWEGFGEDGAFQFEMLRDHLREQAREGDRKFWFRALRHVVSMDQRKVARQKLVEQLMFEHAITVKPHHLKSAETFLNAYAPKPLPETAPL